MQEIEKLTEMLFKEMENAVNNKTTKERSDIINKTAHSLNEALKLKINYEKFKAETDGFIK